MKNNQARDLEIEHRLSTIEEKIDKLTNNDVSHLARKVDRIIWLLITTLTAVLVHAVGSILNKL